LSLGDQSIDFRDRCNVTASNHGSFTDRDYHEDVDEFKTVVSINSLTEFIDTKNAFDFKSCVFLDKLS